MANVRIVLNSAGVEELLKSEEVRADLERRARNIAEAAGDGFEASSEIGINRARAEVRADTIEAKQAETTERRLTAAIDAGRT